VSEPKIFDRNKMSLGDIMGNWLWKLEDPDNDMTDDNPVDPSIQEEDEIVNENFNMTEYRRLIANAPAYKWLLSTIQKEMSLVTTGPSQSTLKNEIRNLFTLPAHLNRKSAADSFQMKFEMQWDFVTFAEEQLYEEAADNIFERQLRSVDLGKMHKP
jgi:hypothetical protein